MKTVFGPVPSRRLGQSLGIDPIPLKTCNWNCVYCQLGRSTPMVNERKEYIPAETILSDVQEALAEYKPEDIDWVTFVGSGEPTLHSKIGFMIRALKKHITKPIAVITNGALLYLPEVREELMPADAVLPSLDAGSPELYQRINRPWPTLTFDRLVEGLERFSAEYQGHFWVEIMLMKDLNDTEPALRDLAQVLERINPDKVQLNLPIRPPAETYVQPSDDAGLMRALAILGESADVVHPAQGSFGMSGADDLLEAILGIITRHPMREDELVRTLEEWNAEEINQALEKLEKSNRAQILESYGHHFWSAAESTYQSGDH